MAFRFKQFSVEDDKASMKVGTDAVLLGAWATHPQAGKILDIGCGSGVLSLMMSQRFSQAEVTGIDIHSPSVLQSQENFNRSKYHKRLQALNISLQDYATASDHKFDLIISNPPFFTNALLPPDPKKANAKHTQKLSFKEMASCVKHLLAAKGVFALILPALDQEKFECEARNIGLYKSREMIIRPVDGKEPNRIISEWTKAQHSPSREFLSIRTKDKNYSTAYIELTQDFYLALKL